MDINEGNLRTLFTGFKAAFNQGFEGVPSFYKKVAMETKSNTFQEEYGWLGQFPRIREWIGDRVINNLVTRGYTITNRDFESTIAIDRNKIKDDQYGIFSPMFKEMGREVAEFPDVLIAELINAAYTNFCYDGQYFFDTDHPVMDALGVPQFVSNYQAGTDPAWYLIDNTRAVGAFIYQEREPFYFTSLDKPDDDRVFMKREYIYGVHGRANAGYGLWQLAYASKAPLTHDNYGAARTAMRTMRGDGGRKLGINPTMLLVPTQLESAARKVVVSTALANGESNEWAGSAELTVTPWLD